MKAEIGSLVTIKVDFQLSRDMVIREGDYGIIIGYAEEESCAVFDYLVVCNGIEIYLFNYEIELVN